MILLVGAGNETTMPMLGNARHAARRNPDQRAKALVGHITDRVDETLRYAPSTQAVARTTIEDVELHGVRSPVGQAAAGGDRRSSVRIAASDTAPARTVPSGKRKTGTPAP